MEKSCPNTWAFGDDVQSFSHYTQQLIDLWPQKLVVCSLVGAICQFFYIEPVILTTWLLALVSDLVLGIWVGIHVEHKFDWSKWHKGILKIISYILFAAIAAVGGMVINRAIGGFAPAIPWMFVLMAAMTVTELKSISRNLEILGFRMPPEVKFLLGTMSRRTKTDLKNLEGPQEAKPQSIDKGEEDGSTAPKDGDLK